VPNDVCAERAQYTININSPNNGRSYYVVYQRCCRNNTINNIFNPGQTGATNFIELTPDALNLCNNSPEFIDFPPLLVCVNQDIDFNHSAADIDGDQLVYSFCSPLDGGGTDGVDTPGNAASCTGVQPQPSCPPPFQEISYILPTYSPTEPMAGDPVVSIDPVTGIISGVPTTIGRFVVGVCVEEFRNGVLLSRIQRDFQFYVVNCTPVVDARIEADDMLGDDTFLIRSCGDSTVTINNLSVQQQFIEEFEWVFDINGTPQVFNDFSPTIVFPDTGRYFGVLRLNRNFAECSDSAFVAIDVYPGLTSDLSFTFDTCDYGPVTFTNESFTEASTITEYAWDFGEGNTSNLVDPIHLYEVPGNLPVSLTITDNNGCQDIETEVIEYFPVPDLIIVEPSEAFGCAPQALILNNLSLPIDDSYDIIWDLGDGNSSTAISPFHIYNDPGVYDISVEITSPIGCFTSAFFPQLVTVRESPISDFTFSPQTVNSFNPTVDFTELATDAIAFEWIFDDEGFSFDPNPTYTFRDTGLQVVSLVVTHPSGCKDTSVQIIDIVPEVTFFLPNAFTPNGDDVNDFFLGAGFKGGIVNFDLSVWNRWGEQIFQTSNPDEGWNGRKDNVGSEVQNGVYVYQLSYTNPRGENISSRGFVTLIR